MSPRMVVSSAITRLVPIPTSLHVRLAALAGISIPLSTCFLLLDKCTLNQVLVASQIQHQSLKVSVTLLHPKIKTHSHNGSSDRDSFDWHSSIYVVGRS